MSHFKKILVPAALVLLGAAQANALDTSYYTSQSVLAGGHWVKVKVSEPGIHEITYDQLKKWGFDDPSKVSVYGYGGAMLTGNNFSTNIPDDLCQQHILNSTLFSKILFYGEPDRDVRIATNTALSIKRNFYSTTGCYFITDSQPLATVEQIPVNINRSVYLSTHSHLEYMENDVMNPMAGGVFFFDRSLIDNPQAISMPVKDFEKNGSFSGSLIYRFASDAYNGLVLSLQNGNNCFTIPSGSRYPSIATVTTDISRVFNLSSQDAIPLTAGSNAATLDKWDFTISMPRTFSSYISYAAIDYAALIYSRSNNMADQAQLIMYYPEVDGARTNFRLSGTQAGTDYTQVWNIDNAADVRPYALGFSGAYTVASFDRSYSSSTGAARVVAFKPGMQQLVPEYAGPVAAQNLHGDPVPDMIIITPENMLSQAQRLADIHKEHQGMDVKVVGQEEIFNEFSSGTPAAHAVRRYVKMHYDRNPEKMRHLIIFGLGSWDNRHLIIPDQNHLITYQVENPDHAALHAKCYAADSYFGLLDDDTSTGNILQGMMRINVGRMPVNNLSDATAVVDKIEKYFLDPPVYGSYNRALLLCDDGDSNDHLLQSDAVAANIQTLSPSTTVTKCYNALYPFNARNEAVMLRDALKSYLQMGQGYFGYAGHGRADRLGADQVLWSLTEINSTDYPIAPFTMLSTCNTYCFDRASSDITGHMMRKAGGGAINIIAACRSVYKKHNQTFNLQVANAYFTAKNGDNSGDIYRLARNATLNLNTGSSKEELAVNTMCYNFAGDPAIPLYVPTLNVKTTVVGEFLADRVEEANVYPLTPFNLSGTITDADGRVVDTFNGKVTIDIYDGAQTVRSSAKGEGGNEAYTSDVFLDETLLTKTTVPVENGRFSTSIVSPVPIRPEVPNRISYYAANDDNTLFAAGTYNHLNVNPYNAEAIANPDTEGPEITELYINTPDFVSGGEVDSEITVVAKIAADASGFNVSGGKIGNGAKLILDGAQNYQYVASSIQNNVDGSAVVHFGISDLLDGYHTLEFSVADNAGNRSFATLAFTVVNRSATASLKADNTPARTDVTFSLDHTFTTAPTGRLIVEDNLGNTVLSLEDCTFPYTWDLRDMNNSRVPDGAYNAYVVLSSGHQYGNTERLPIVVIE